MVSVNSGQIALEHVKSSPTDRMHGEKIRETASRWILEAENKFDHFFVARLMQDLYLFNCWLLCCLFNVHDDKFLSLFNWKVSSSSGSLTKRFSKTFFCLQFVSCKILHNFVSCSTNCETIYHCLHLWCTLECVLSKQPLQSKYRKMIMQTRIGSRLKRF